jgi:hypothetical protein
MRIAGGGRGISWTRTLAVWLLLTAAEVVHGTVRAILLTPRVGDHRSRQIGLFTGSAIILALSGLTIRWLGVRRTPDLLAIGGVWLILTVAFEVALGRLAFGYSWTRVTEDFDPRRGGLLPFGLAVLALAPLITARLRLPPERRER